MYCNYEKIKYNGKVFAPIYFNNGECTKYIINKCGDIINTKTDKKLKWKIDSRGVL